MTDRTIIPLAGGFDLMVAPHPGGVRVSLLPSGGVSLLPSGGAPGHVTATVNTGALLTAIDRADSDALRAYLRERSDYLDAVPEADSPEDVDEHAVIELTDDIDTRLHVIERLAKILRAGTDAVEVCTLADWVMDR